MRVPGCDTIKLMKKDGRRPRETGAFYAQGNNDVCQRSRCHPASLRTTTRILFEMTSREADNETHE